MESFENASFLMETPKTESFENATIRIGKFYTCICSSGVSYLSPSTNFKEEFAQNSCHEEKKS